MYILKTIRKYGDNKERVSFSLYEKRTELQEEVNSYNPFIKRQYDIKFECFELFDYINNEYCNLLLDIDNAFKKPYLEDAVEQISNLIADRIKEILKYPNKYGMLFKL